MTIERAYEVIRAEYNANRISPSSLRKPISIILSQEPCDDVVSRQAILSKIKEVCFSKEWTQFRVDNGSRGQRDFLINYIRELPPVTQKLKIGHCKECKYFEYDSVAKVDGVPLIVAHEICSKWGDGCKTKEDGYCFLYEPQESEEQTE